MSVNIIVFAISKRPSSYPFISGDTFRTISNHIIDEEKIPFNPQRVCDGDIIFVATHLCDYFFSTLHPKINVHYIIITHNSDYSPINFCAKDHPSIGLTFEKYLSDPKIIVWFAQNVDFIHAKLIPIPIGIANCHWSHGDINIFGKAIQNIPILESRKNLLYCNFKIINNIDERQGAFNYIKNKNFCYMAAPKQLGEYLEEMKQFKFVLSPPGNGLDCHRTWECLMMGCIPIIKHSTIDNLFDDLPVIFVDDWTDITYDFLMQKYEEIKNKTFNMKKIYADYWIDQIHHYQQQYCS